MGVLVEMPVFGLVGVGLLGLASAMAQSPLAARQRRLCSGGLFLAVVSSLLAGAGLWSVRKGVLTDNYYAIMSGLVAVTILPLSRAVTGARLRAWWMVLGFLWAFFGGLVLLVEAYACNRAVDFYVSLPLLVILIMLLQRSYRMPFTAILALNTMILLLIGIPVFDLILRAIPHPARKKPDPHEELYLYHNAVKDPASFGRWCETFDAEFHKMIKEAFMPDPTGRFLPRPKPGARTRYFESEISINSLGFRGKEISRDKGDAYRIVAIGESTTFGVTLRADDSPWPDVLEQLIRNRLQPQRPVEVINAGISCWELKANIRRLTEEILALRPDMIISYHGYNGFGMISGVMPLSNRYVAPIYRLRPVKLLAECEYRLRIMYAVRSEQALLADHASATIDPLRTDYAQAYRELIQIAQTNHIRLVLADYCMAVNEHSSQDVLNFYRRRYPSVTWRIKDNQMHTTIVRRLAEIHPEVRFVDTHPNLDGDHYKFIDLMHFTQAGRQQLAETLFAGIRDLLERDLAAPGSGKEAASAQGR